MFILTIAGAEDEGAYSVVDAEGERALYMFEDEDDAERFAGLLEAEDYPEMDVVEVEDEVAINTCNVYNYRYVIISPEEFVIPPREYDFIQTDKMA
jgi:hypothetical protein|tara:strand:+ start:1053 stop:1340 length:288 start_codon:yes stop_codon:yes gene_type:complete